MAGKKRRSKTVIVVKSEGTSTLFPEKVKEMKKLLRNVTFLQD